MIHECLIGFIYHLHLETIVFLLTLHDDSGIIPVHYSIDKSHHSSGVVLHECEYQFSLVCIDTPFLDSSQKMYYKGHSSSYGQGTIDHHLLLPVHLDMISFYLRWNMCIRLKLWTPSSKNVAVWREDFIPLSMRPLHFFEAAT